MTYHTEKKDRVLAFFREKPDEAFPIEQVCRAILTDGSGKSSVYRIVSGLVDEGILCKISEPNSRHCSYQYVGGEHCAEHLHLKCVGCGRLIHLDGKTSQTLEKQILSSENFELDEGALLFGKCAVCRHKCKSFFAKSE